MRIAVYGGTGAIGSRIVNEALSRGHEVTSISRRGGDLQGDALDPAFTTAVAEKHDVIVSAIGPSRSTDDGTRYADSIANLVHTLGDRRLLVVGGAGSLTIDGTRLLDRPDFPDAYKAEAAKIAVALDLLRSTPEGVDWTYLSPAPVIQPGERTGAYKTGLESPVGDTISIEDYAVAMIDEIEQRNHVRQRFTVAS